MKSKIVYALITLLVGGLLFYWFQLRPSLIIKSCHQWIVDQPGSIEDRLDIERHRAEYNALYQSCLHKSGLK